VKRALILLLLLSGAERAAAQNVPCDSLINPLYMASTSIMKPLYGKIGPALASATGQDQMTLVYVGISTCTAYGYVLPPGQKLTGTATYWTPGTGEVGALCDLPTGGVDPHLAIGDVTFETCRPTETMPSGIAQFQTYAQGFGFIVPRSSSQTAITAEEAYFLLKFGGEAGKQVLPWTDPNFVIIRNPNSSTQLTIGFSAGISGTQWSSNFATNSTSQDVMNKVVAQSATGNAEKTIGIMATEVYDTRRADVKLLAFQAFQQKCLGGAVYPDSTATAFDKRNLRDGHYEIFGYTYALAAVDGAGAVADARAKRFVDFLRGTDAVNGVDPVKTGALVGSVHTCAMRVRKAYDGAPIEPYQPSAPCGCYFEAATPAGTDCQACNSATACPTGKTCRFGYCEDN
jgi:hypothetical protein